MMDGKPAELDPAEELRVKLAGLVDQLDAMMVDASRCTELLAGRARLGRDPRVVAIAKRGMDRSIEVFGLMQDAAGGLPGAGLGALRGEG